jgi:isocitrate dehydrogenase (NAD+)
VIRGDGIGPEIMDATLRVLDTLKLGFQYDFVEAGLAAQEKFGELLPQAKLDAIAKHRIALKSPLTTPVGEGFSSINVVLRKHFDLYANVRPAISFPNTRSRFPGNVDLISVRENTEGAYIGEGQHVAEDGATATLAQKITRRGSDRIVRYAFELARRCGRKKVSIVHKANILKSTSGLFLKVAREVAAQYPDIACNELIVDNCCMQVVMRPEQFGVIVTTNLFGDIISDLRRRIGRRAWIGPEREYRNRRRDFRGGARLGAGHRRQGHRESVRAAARRAQMLDHLELRDEATRLRKAIRDTLAARDRVTPDLGGAGTTQSFADALIERLA